MKRIPGNTLNLELPRDTVARFLRTNHTEPNAAAAYLARLSDTTSAPTQASALRHISRALLGDTSDAGDVEPWMLVPWGNLRAEHFRALHDALCAAGAAPATVHRYMSALRQTALEAARLGQMTSDDHCDIEDTHFSDRRRERPAPGRMLSEPEISQLFASCQNDWRGKRDRALLGLMLTTGIRRQEAASARCENYDRKARTLRVTIKGGREHVVFMHDGAARAIDHWLAYRDMASPWLFPGNSGDPITGQGVLHALKVRARHAGVAPFTAHDLRRTFASHLFAAGAGNGLISELLGHVSGGAWMYDRRFPGGHDMESIRAIVEAVHGKRGPPDPGKI